MHIAVHSNAAVVGALAQRKVVPAPEGGANNKFVCMCSCAKSAVRKGDSEKKSCSECTICNAIKGVEGIQTDANVLTLTALPAVPKPGRIGMTVCCSRGMMLCAQGEGEQAFFLNQQCS